MRLRILSLGEAANARRLSVMTLVLLWMVCSNAQILAQGTVIYSTYDGVQPGDIALIVQTQHAGEWYGARVASQFATGGQSCSLNSIVAFASGSSPAGLSLGIYNDDSGVPGNLLFTLGTPDDFGTAGNYSFQASGHILNPETTYWVVGQSAVGSSANWWTGTATQPMIAHSRLSADSGLWIPWSLLPSAPLSMVVYASPVPEPSTHALMALAVAALISSRQRMRGTLSVPRFHS